MTTQDANSGSPHPIPPSQPPPNQPPPNQPTTGGPTPPQQRGGLPQTGAPGQPPPSSRPARRRGGLLAIIVSTVALLVALAAVLVAWRALDQAHDARDIALAGRGQGPGQDRTPSADRSATSPSPAGSSGASAGVGLPPAAARASGEPPPLDQRTVYKLKYEKQSLTLKATCGSMYADVDEPRANVSSADYDVMLRGSCSGGPGTLVLDEGASGSEEGAPGMTPQDCADKIRTAPMGNAVVPANKGVVMCMTTSFAAAQKQGQVQRMVLLEVTGVAADGAVTVQLTAWDIPR